MARYDVQDTYGDDINSAVVPGNINNPVVFLAPPQKTKAGGEIWIATSSTDSNHGGCVVWVSNDNTDYKRIGRIEGQARQGVLLAALPSVAGTDETNTLAVDMSLSAGELESVSQATVNRFDSLCYVGGEFLAFRDVTVVDVDHYDVDYLQRGLYGSSTGASSGADFVAIDNAVFRYRFNKAAVGDTLYFKFQAFNPFGAGLQDLSSCISYAFLVPADGGVVAFMSDLTPITESITALALLKFLTATNRLAGLEYIDSTHTAVAHTFTAASIGRRGYDMDTKRFFDISDVVDGVAVWVSGTSVNDAASTQAINFLSLTTTTGTIPRLVGSLALPAGTYQAPAALLGAGDPAYIATLTLATPSGEALATVGGVAGGVAWRTAASGFVLATDTAIDLLLSCSAVKQPAFIHGITINKV